MKEKQKEKTNSIYYYLFALGLSLQWFTIKLGVPISITDITILLLLLYSMIFHQKIILNLMTLFIFIFAMDILIANIVNYYLETNYI